MQITAWCLHKVPQVDRTKYPFLGLGYIVLFAIIILERLFNGSNAGGFPFSSISLGEMAGNWQWPLGREKGQLVERKQCLSSKV